jgi:hypothetical protein
MNSTEVILRFIGFLAQVSTSFNRVAEFAEKQKTLHSVTTKVSPFKAKPSEYADAGVSIAVFLNAELRKPIDSERKAIGMSLLLRHTTGKWLAEAEVGWTGEKVGWDQFDSKEAQASTINEVMNKVPPLVEWTEARFREEVAKLPE